MDKEKDIDYILETELSPDRYCYIHNCIIELQQENKQLKSILTELEEHLEKEWNITSKSPKGSFYEGYDTCMLEMKKDIQNKIQKLKEKYK